MSQAAVDINIQCTIHQIRIDLKIMLLILGSSIGKPYAVQILIICP